MKTTGTADGWAAREAEQRFSVRMLGKTPTVSGSKFSFRPNQSLGGEDHKWWDPWFPKKTFWVSSSKEPLNFMAWLSQKVSWLTKQGVPEHPESAIVCQKEKSSEPPFVSFRKLEIDLLAQAVKVNDTFSFSFKECRIPESVGFVQGWEKSPPATRYNAFEDFSLSVFVVPRTDSGLQREGARAFKLHAEGAGPPWCPYGETVQPFSFPYHDAVGDEANWRSVGCHPFNELPPNVR